MSDSTNLAELRERVASLGFAVVHIDALRTAQVYLECSDPDQDSLRACGIGLGEFGSALNSVADAIQSHDRAQLRAITKRAKRAPTT
jgi:hypothetical protein